MNKWYMHKLESVFENVKHKILWDFVGKTDHLIRVRKLDVVIINKERKKKKVKRELAD